ncbi:PREDICTED: uncharacterized protein LOC105970567 [Erythranthe guttata]|uniref:uncharacterized protein LOC105970567 n=1 Tax=Erythranthe guttata TaxID=4155 RepID=UPI00064D99C8|nr:PREDICTED: uncharacterized protein LOC105970567 [Erythranthe guttata]|eukprot:XP_012850854.1 PREDICTED: uncharacterized protein LOC105970567 [Erythranthe guttata]
MSEKAGYKEERIEQRRMSSMAKRFQELQDRMEGIVTQLKELNKDQHVRGPYLRRDVHQPVLPHRDNEVYGVTAATPRDVYLRRGAQFDRPRRGYSDYYERELDDYPRSSKYSVHSSYATELKERRWSSRKSRWNSSSNRHRESIPREATFDPPYETKERGYYSSQSRFIHDTKCFWCLGFGHVASDCLDKPFMKLRSNYEELKRKGDSLSSLGKEDTRQAFENQNIVVDLASDKPLIEEKLSENVEVESKGEENCKSAPPLKEEIEGSDSRTNPFEEVENDMSQPCIEVNAELSKV